MPNGAVHHWYNCLYCQFRDLTLDQELENPHQRQLPNRNLTLFVWVAVAVAVALAGITSFRSQPHQEAKQAPHNRLNQSNKQSSTVHTNTPLKAMYTIIPRYPDPKSNLRR